MRTDVHVVSGDSACTPLAFPCGWQRQQRRHAADRRVDMGNPLALSYLGGRLWRAFRVQVRRMIARSGTPKKA